MSKYIDINHHFCITSTDKVVKLIKPLTNAFDVKYFRYLRLYKDKSRILLSNFPDCTRFAYEEGHFKKMWFEGECPDYLKEGFNLWKTPKYVMKSDIEKEINHNLGLFAGITYVSQSRDHWELFTFDSEKDDLCLINRKIFTHFMFYFKESARELILKGDRERLILPSLSKIDVDDSVQNEKINQFLNETKTDRFYLTDEHRDVYLTCKEASCIYWLVQGKTSEEIALIEGNSKKTIERHFENIKNKLKCYKQTQLIKIIINSGVLDAISLQHQDKYHC